MTLASAKILRKSEAPPVFHTLGMIMLVVTMVVVGGAYGLTAWLRSGTGAAAGAGAGPTVTRTLVGHSLSIPESWLRDGTGRPDQFATEVDLEVRLPLGRDGALSIIDVTLLPLSQARPSSSLLDGVYLHQFMPAQLAGPHGLVGKPLYAGEGYENETVWYDAIDSNPFVAKCDAAPDGKGQARCLRTVALPGGIAAIYSFDADVLASWQQFDPDMQGWLSRIGTM